MEKVPIFFSLRNDRIFVCRSASGQRVKGSYLKRPLLGILTLLFSAGVFIIVGNINIQLYNFIIESLR